MSSRIGIACLCTQVCLCLTTSGCTPIFLAQIDVAPVSFIIVDAVPTLLHALVLLMITQLKIMCGLLVLLANECHVKAL